MRASSASRRAGSRSGASTSSATETTTTSGTPCASVVDGAGVVLVPGSPLSHPDHAWLNGLLASRVPPEALGLYAEQPYTLRQRGTPFARVDARPARPPREVARDPRIPLAAPAPRDAAKPASRRRFVWRWPTSGSPGPADLGSRAMKLVMTLLVRDEADIVDAQIAFHLDAGVDFVVATDNRSEDGTTEILERYAREGHLHLIREPGDDLRQSEWVTRMARLAATEFGADWVINADADEFWWPRGGDFRALFAAVPERFGVVRGAWRNFVPRPDDDRFFAERMTVTALRSRRSIRIR